MKILIANPSYSPGFVSGIAQLVATRKHPDWELHFFEPVASLLTLNFNCAWTEALNLRASHGLTHFLLVHADVRPRDENWLDTMIAEMNDCQADILSVIIPIKGEEGLTSTAIDSDEWCPARITMNQVRSELPDTWTADNLLFNTGLMLVDFRKSWVEKVCFRIRDKIL